MPNPNYSKLKTGQGGQNKAMGSSPSMPMPETTANWPGLPGKASASRGTPQKGSMGPFSHKKVGM